MSGKKEVIRLAEASFLSLHSYSVSQISGKLCAVCNILSLTSDSMGQVFSNQFLSLPGLASQSALSLREDRFFSSNSSVHDFAMLCSNVRTSSLLSVNPFSDFCSHRSQYCSWWKSQIYVVVAWKESHAGCVLAQCKRAACLSTLDKTGFAFGADVCHSFLRRKGMRQMPWLQSWALYVWKAHQFGSRRR